LYLNTTHLDLSDYDSDGLNFHGRWTGMVAVIWDRNLKWMIGLTSDQTYQEIRGESRDCSKGRLLISLVLGGWEFVCTVNY
jgi:hypothetical protein